jgi:tetratricopeptide (TPR) repeat protein
VPGKTRLARHFCQLSAQAGWNVWQAEYDPAGSVARLPERLAIDGTAGTLVLVDYAERWPMAQLLALLCHPLLSALATPVRVLLLARPAGTWWAVLSYRLGRLGITAEAHELAPLAGKRAIPALYAHARDRFAELLDVPGCEAIQTPDLSSEDYELVLAVHMAALVAVDARLSGREVPAEPARLSAYLLDRERAAWRTLPPENQRPRSGETELGRAVYLAALTGPLSYREGADALALTRLVGSDEAASGVLADHALLYPPRLAGSVLEPLRPDRLAEDYLARTTPGEGGPPGLSDPWARDVPQLLLAGDDQRGPVPSWVRPGVAMLIETALRWPHVAVGQLYPLLRANPGLALTAGASAFTSLVEWDQVDLDVLELIEPHLSDTPDFEFDLAIAVLARRLAERRLVVTGDPVGRAEILQRLGWRYSNAGLPEQALTAFEEEVSLMRGIDSGFAHRRRLLARALQSLSIELAGLGRRNEALAAVEEAADLYRLADPDSGTYLADLALVRLFLGDRLAAVGREDDALVARQAALDGFRQLATGVSARDHTWDLAVAAESVSDSLLKMGKCQEALELGEEAVALARQLVAKNRNAHLRLLAATLEDMAAALGSLGRRGDQRQAFSEAVDLNRELARANPNAFLGALAASLAMLSNALVASGDRAEALAMMEESVANCRDLAASGSESSLIFLAAALTSVADRLAEAERREDAYAAAREAVELLAGLAGTGAAGIAEDVARATCTLGRRLTGLGRSGEAIATFREAIDRLRRLRLGDAQRGNRLVPALANALGCLSGELLRAGEVADALKAGTEAVSLLREPPPGVEVDRDDLADALTKLGRVLAQLPDRVGEALELAREVVDLRRATRADQAGPRQLALVEELFDLSTRLCAAGRADEALPVTDEE